MGHPLTDYKVRILDSSAATGATTRVLIDSRNETHSWSTVGASSNIIEASLHALVDSIEYGLLDCGTDPLGYSEQKATERSDVGAARGALEAT